MTCYKNTTIQVRLARRLDDSQPVLEAKVLESTGSPGSVRKVEITGDHKVWRGAVLRMGNFKVVGKLGKID